MIAVVAISLLISSANALTGWTYSPTDSTCVGTVSDPCGPTYWPQVPGASGCAGVTQTPINIVQSTFDPNMYGPVLTAEGGGCTMWTQFSSNSTFELGFENPNEDMDCEALTLSYEGVDYTMVQLHFHSPSEHTFGGGHYSAEVHMVHKSADGLYLVLGALLQESADTIQHSNNTFLNTLWDAGGSQLLGGVPIFINASSALDPYSSFLPQSRVQYAYSGSLTTPPCTENVQWILFQFPVIISISDIYLLRKLMNMNSASDAILYDGNSNRPLQPLNGRTVYWSYGEVPDSSIYTPYADGNDDDKIAHTALGLGATAFVFAIVGIVLGGLALTLLKKSDGAAPPTPAAAPAAPVAAVELKGQPAAAPIKSPMAEETPV